MRSHSGFLALLVTAQLVTAQLLAAAPPAMAQAAPLVTIDLEIPMSDGAVMKGDLYQPVGEDGQPIQPNATILIHTPYNKDDPARSERGDIDAFVAAGFTVLFVDVRGTGDSNGLFNLLDNREAMDGYEIVEWAAAQPWSDGHIGMYGYSYPGLTAARAAMLHPPHLDAIVPAAAYQDAYRDILYPGGIQASEDVIAVGLVVAIKAPYFRVGAESSPDDLADNTADAIAQHPTVFADALAHTLYDEYWQERAVDPRQLTVPTLFWSGWDDIYPRGTLHNYRLAPSPENALVMGPWGHLGTIGPMGDLLAQDAIRWFDIYLRTPPGPERDAKRAEVPNVRLFQVGAEADEPYLGQWQGLMEEFDHMPATQATRLALCAGGPGQGDSTPWPTQGALLDAGTACDAEGALDVIGGHEDITSSLSITHDAIPANEPNDSQDQRANLGATAMLGPVLEEDVVITGMMQADLWATTTADEAEWVVKVVDVGPDGTRVIGRGWLRGSHRALDPSHGFLWHPHDAVEPVVAGEPYPLSVEIWPSDWRVLAGHRLGALIQAADPRKVTPGTAPGASTVLFGPDHPSSITVPIRLADAGDPIPPADALVRHGGPERYSTAVEVSRATFGPGVRVAYVASGEDFPDALAGGPAAAREDGPVLLATRDQLPSVTAQELERLQPGRIVLLGGTATLSAELEQVLQAYGPVERRAGATRYETAALTSAAVFGPGGPVAYLASGEAFADALAGGGAAALRGAPLLLTRPDELPSAALEELHRLAPATIVVIGGPGAVSDAVQQQLAAEGFTVERRAGATRFETATALAGDLDPAAVEGAWIATGADFPDALTAAPAAARAGAPILLVEPDSVPPVVGEAIADLGVSRITVVGGIRAITEAVAEELSELLV